MTFRLYEQTTQVGSGLAFRNSSVSTVHKIIFVDRPAGYENLSPLFAADKALSQRLIYCVHSLLFPSVGVRWVLSIAQEHCCLRCPEIKVRGCMPQGTLLQSSGCRQDWRCITCFAANGLTGSAYGLV